jgi:hypothetical protein
MLADSDGVVLFAECRCAEDSVLADDCALTHVDPRAFGVENRARHRPGAGSDGDLTDQFGARRDIGGRIHDGGGAAVAKAHPGRLLKGRPRVHATPGPAACGPHA